ncbi:hypothetical protein MASR2M15_00400 [Anaerolineales bacterium]
MSESTILKREISKAKVSGLIIFVLILWCALFVLLGFLLPQFGASLFCQPGETFIQQKFPNQVSRLNLYCVPAAGVAYDVSEQVIVIGALIFLGIPLIVALGIPVLLVMMRRGATVVEEDQPDVR